MKISDHYKTVALFPLDSPSDFIDSFPWQQCITMDRERGRWAAAPWDAARTLRRKKVAIGGQGANMCQRLESVDWMFQCQ